MRKIIYPPSTLVRFPSLFGSGKDGNVTISSNTTLTRDMYYENLTIESGKYLNTNGFKIFVRNVLINRGVIRNNGSDASGQNGGAGAPEGTLKGGSAGGKAGQAAYDHGKDGEDVINGLGGQGGEGGQGSFSNGGLGGTIYPPPEIMGGIDEFIAALTSRPTGQPYPRGFYKMYKNGNQSITNASWQQILNWTSIENDGKIFKTAPGGFTHTCKKTGLYLINLHVVFAANSTGIRSTKIRVNNTDVISAGYSKPAATIGETIIDITTILKLSFNDELDFNVYQNSGGSLNILGGDIDYKRTAFNIVLLSNEEISFKGGSGGGGGGGRDFVTAGGGGGGGGVILIAANIIDNKEGRIEAKGGAGASGSSGFAAGGGGGGGGAVILVYSNLIEGIIDVSGGPGGLRGDGQPSGNPGQSGNIFRIKAL